MLLHKLLPFAVPKPAFFQLNSTNISYAEILQRSRRELVSCVAAQQQDSSGCARCSLYRLLGGGVLVLAWHRPPTGGACDPTCLQQLPPSTPVLTSCRLCSRQCWWQRQQQRRRCCGGMRLAPCLLRWAGRNKRASLTHTLHGNKRASCRGLHSRPRP